MEYKLLEEQDIPLMKNFLDDGKTEYDEALLNAFLKEKMHTPMWRRKMV